MGNMLGPYNEVLFVCGLSNPRAAGHCCLWLHVTTYLFTVFAATLHTWMTPSISAVSEDAIV